MMGRPSGVRCPKGDAPCASKCVHLVESPVHEALKSCSLSALCGVGERVRFTIASSGARGGKDTHFRFVAAMITSKFRCHPLCLSPILDRKRNHFFTFGQNLLGKADDYR